MANFVGNNFYFQQMKLNVSISPCPNDTFMFEAWINQRIQYPQHLHFDFHFADIKTLNQWALNNETDITKISVFTAGQILNNYELLTVGSALGYKNGPLIISKKKIYPDEIPYAKIGVPGFNTTANLLLQLFYHPKQASKEYFFNEIEEALLENEIDAGVIIHETRFTYQKKGLQKIADLGEQWEATYQLPLPLGAIAIKRNLPRDIKKTINHILYQSISFAIANPEASMSFIKAHAQETAENVIKQHIDLYVNDFSLNIGSKGKEAVTKLMSEGIQLHLLPSNPLNVFIDEE